MRVDRGLWWTLTLLGILLAAAVILSVWLPVWRHYHVGVPSIDADTVERSRVIPPDETLEEIGSLKHRLVPPIGIDYPDPVAVADEILATTARESGRSLLDVHRLGDLDYVSLGVPRVLLSAYASSGNPTYLEEARRFLTEFAEFERKTWRPRGLLWNDHAVGVRSVALSEFWRHYRQGAGYDADTARAFLQHVAATGYRLADPRHYTYRSNHGTMQNLGLLHLSLAFPELPGFPAFGDLALTRHREQMAYLFSEEGIWLENSAGYHRLGLELSGIFLRYLTLRGEQVPPDLGARYEAARTYYAQLRAPDGSLPRIGDTMQSTIHQEPLTTTIDAQGRARPMVRVDATAPVPGENLYPEAGQLLWWSEDAPGEQTAITWSCFDRHAHKHADELSLHIRSVHGRWVTAAGYWPFTHEWRERARSWEGSNAPHLVGEPRTSDRRSRLRAHAWTDELRAVDVERRGPGAFVARRQIIHVNPSLWLIVDAFEDDAPRTARTIWTLETDIGVRSGPSSDRFLLVKAADGVEASAWFLSADGSTPTGHRGSAEPFAGWVEVDYHPVETEALVVEVPSDDDWSALVFSLRPELADDAAVATMVEWSGPEQWRLVVRSGTASEPSGLTVIREDQRLSVENASGTAGEAILTSVDDLPGEAIVAAYGEAEARYGPGFSDLTSLREKLTMGLVIVFLAQEILLWILGRISRRAWLVARLGSMVVWLLAAGWIHTSYLGPNGGL